MKNELQKMRSPRQTQVCCESCLCQHPDCWKFNLQRVREAVWRRNGIKSEDLTPRSSMKVDQVYLAKEQRLESTDGGLPTLNIVDMFSDLDGRIKSAPGKQLKQPNLHRRSTSLPSLSPEQSYQTSPQQTRIPYPSPAITPSAVTEYQRKMQWKKQFINPSRAGTLLSEEGKNGVKVSTIGVHELYEPEELYQNWEEVYVTSAYLVWCPSNKKRKKRRGSSLSSRSSSKKPNSHKIIPKDMTEDLVPAAMETVKPVRPKSTKTPTGGQPYSPHKSPMLRHYGMEDLSDLPKPILSGMLKRINQRSNDVTPEQFQSKYSGIASIPTRNTEMASSQTKETSVTKSLSKAKTLLDDVDLSADFDSLLTREESVSKVRLAVDINSRFTTPEEDEEIEKQNERNEKEMQEFEANKEKNEQLDFLKKVDEKLSTCKSSRGFLRMNSIGVPIDDLPSPKSHHCTSSIPRMLNLGAALEPVNLVPVLPSPANTPPQEPEISDIIQYDKTSRSKMTNEFVVNIPHGRGGSAMELSPQCGEEDRLCSCPSLRSSPSPVRAPAPTPISPDKYSDFFRLHSRVSQAYLKASLQDDDLLSSMRRWNTLSNVFGAQESALQEGISEDPVSVTRDTPIGKEDTNKDQEVTQERIFLTEGFEPSDSGMHQRPATPDTAILFTDKMVIDLKEPPAESRGRSPSPGSKTRIPKDIIEEFHGNLYGKQFSRSESRSKRKENTSKTKEIVLGPKITVSGWRHPRSRTPIPFAETPARFPPRPLKQPPQESVPKSLKIVSLPTGSFQRPRSTPPRITTPSSDYIAQVLSESSLHQSATGGTSLDVQCPSTNVSGTGSVPPPPSPEALVLSKDLNKVSTLEPLCEEDERSSRATSIADFAERGFGNPRLSPLGGGSEISEESVDLPIELCESTEDIDETNAQENIEKPAGKYVSLDAKENARENQNVDQEGQHEGHQEGQHEGQHKGHQEGHQEGQHEGQHKGHQEGHQEGQHEGQHKGHQEDHQKGHQECDTNTEKELLESKEQSNEERLDNDKGAEDTKVSSSSPLPESFISKEPQATELLQETNPLDEVPNPSESDKASPSSSLEEKSHPRGSPDPVVQPPGSPDVTSDHDFTEGVDMSLDLAAELQAAMEGLDDFVIDDNENDDDNTGNENIETKDKEDKDPVLEIDGKNDENGHRAGNIDGHIKTDDIDDENDCKNYESRQCNDDKNNGSDDENDDKKKKNPSCGDKTFDNIKIDDKRNDDIDVSLSSLDKVDTEGVDLDRTSPLLDA